MITLALGMQHYSFSHDEANHVELESLTTPSVDKCYHLGKVAGNVLSSYCLKEENNMGSCVDHKSMELLYVIWAK